MVVGERWRCRGSQGSEVWKNDMERMAYWWCRFLVDVQPWLEVLFPDDAVRHREVSGIVQQQGSTMGHKIREFRLSTARHHMLKPIHNSEMDDGGECVPGSYLGPAEGVLGAGGRSRTAQLRK
jgi:hypothetical protein